METKKSLAKFILFLILSSIAHAEGSEPAAGRKMGEIVCTFVYMIEFLAVGLASLLIIFAGVKYLIAGDDPQARSSAKRWMINVFVSILIIFTAVPLINFSTRGLTGPVSCEIVPGEKMLTGTQPSEQVKDNEEISPGESQKTAEEDRVYDLLLGNGPVGRGSDGTRTDGEKNAAAAGNKAGDTYAMPDFLLIAFFLLGISMAFIIGVTAYKMRGYLKR
jgi:hypothetical protein